MPRLEPIDRDGDINLADLLHRIWSWGGARNVMVPFDWYDQKDPVESTVCDFCGCVVGPDMCLKQMRAHNSGEDWTVACQEHAGFATADHSKPNHEQYCPWPMLERMAREWGW